MLGIVLKIVRVTEMVDQGLTASLVVLMGLPGSGKSHLAQEIEKEIKSTQNIAVVIAKYDEFVPHEIQSKFPILSKYNLAKTCRKNFVDSVSYMIAQCRKKDFSDLVYNENTIERELLLTSLPEDVAPKKLFVSKVKDILETISFKCKPKFITQIVIIVDDNNYYSSMREDFYQIAKMYRTGFCVLYCKTSIQTCRRRNSSRPESVATPDKVIVEMSLKLEPPNPIRCPCDAFSVEIPEVLKSPDSTDECNTTNVPLVVQVIESSLKNPVDWSPPPNRQDEIERQQRICSESEIHQADLVLRKWISKEMGLLSLCPRESGVRKASISKQLRQRKDLLLEKLRHGNLQITSDPSQDVEFQQELIKFATNLSLI